MFSFLGFVGVIMTILGILGWSFMGIPCLPIGIICLLICFVGGWYVSPQRQACLLEKAQQERNKKQ